jgi:hypothetical protein
MSTVFFKNQIFLKNVAKEAFYRIFTHKNGCFNVSVKQKFGTILGCYFNCGETNVIRAIIELPIATLY